VCGGADVVSMTVTQLFNLTVELNIPATIEQPHFKASHSMAGETRGTARPRATAA